MHAWPLKLHAISASVTASVRPLSDRIRRRSWDDMARELSATLDGA